MECQYLVLFSRAHVIPLILSVWSFYQILFDAPRDHHSDLFCWPVEYSQSHVLFRTRVFQRTAGRRRHANPWVGHLHRRHVGPMRGPVPHGFRFLCQRPYPADESYRNGRRNDLYVEKYVRRCHY